MTLMRTIRVMLLAVSCSSVVRNVVAQDSFIFANKASIPVAVEAPIYDWTGALLSGPGWRAELYGGLTFNSLTPVVASDSFMREPTSFTQPGYFYAPTDVQVLGVPGSGWAWLQVKVWDVQFGATYEQALARAEGGYGQSALFYAQGGDPQAAPPLIPRTLVGLQSFSVLQPVPEASTSALLAAGLGGLIWCRRR